MAIAGIFLFSIAWLLVFTGLQDALAPINRRLKKARQITPSGAATIKRNYGNHVYGTGRRTLAIGRGHGLETPKAAA